MWLWATYFKLAGHSLDTSCLTVSCQGLERFQLSPNTFGQRRKESCPDPVNRC